MLRAERLAVFLAAISLAMGLALPQGKAATPGKAHYVIGKPYQFDGVWYQPAVDDSYNQTGLANVYPSGRNGLSTTSGEAYDENALAGAHKTLPLPCFVRVTNLANGKAITLRLNDRGPFVDDRIIELTPAAARALNIAGLAQVRVEILAKESQALAAALGGNDQGPQPAPSITPVPTPVVKVTNLPLSNGTSMQPMKPVAAPGAPPPAPYASAPAAGAPALPAPVPAAAPAAAPPAAPAAAPAPAATLAPAPTSAAPSATTIPLAIPLPPAPTPAASPPAVTTPAATTPAVTAPATTAPASIAPIPTTPAAIAPAPPPPAPTPLTPPKPSPAAATIVAPPPPAPAVTIPASATPSAPKAVPAVSVSITNAPAPAVLAPTAVPPATPTAAPAIPVQLTSVPAAPAVKPLPVDLPAQFFIQTGAFKSSAEADQLREKLAPLGPAKIVPTRLGNDPFNAVLLGPIPSMADAQRLLKQITGMGYGDAVLIIE